MKCFYIIYIILGYPISAILSEILFFDNLTIIYRAISLVFCVFFIVNKIKYDSLSYGKFQISLIFFYMLYLLFVLRYFSEGFDHESLTLWRFYLNNTIFFTLMPILSIVSDISDNDIRKIKNYGFFFSLAYLVLIILAWCFGLSDTYRLSFTKLNPISLSISLGIAILFIFWKLKLNAKSISLIIITLVFMVYTGSRGPLLALFVVYTLYLIINARWGYKIFALLSGLFVSVVIVSFYNVIVEYIPIISRFDFSTEKGGMSVSIREYQYKSAIEIFTENPIFGGGLTENHLNMYPHNIILELLMNGGIVLFGCFILTMIFFVLSLSKRVKNIGLFPLDYMIAFLILCTLTTSALPGTGVLAFCMVLATRIRYRDVA